MRACGWACRCVGTWMRMAVNKKEKRRTKPEGLSVWMGLWACSCVGMRMQMAVNKKKKEKKEKEKTY